MWRIREGLTLAGIEPEPPSGAGVVWILEADPTRWLAQFGGALLAGRTVALGGEEMSLAEHAERRRCLDAWDRSLDSVEDPVVLIPTGGTSGRLRWAIHRWSTLCAAAEGFLQFFGTSAGAAVCVLPLHHVGGLMSVIRGWISGERVWYGHYRKIGEALAIPPGVTISLVPTQLGRLLESPSAVAHLRYAGRILIGGAHLDPALAEKARAAKLKLAPCYGMTESAALVAALPPFRFLAGQGGVGRPLPHVEVAWRENVAARELHPEAQRLGLRGASLFHGYWPPLPEMETEPWWTSDAAYADAEGNLQIVGRIDRIILSGGENVDAERVEHLLAPHFRGIRDCVILGLPDADWGERVVAAIVPSEMGRTPLEAELNALARRVLSPWEVPKNWYFLPALPRTGLGKIDLRSLRADLSQRAGGGR